MQIKYKQKRYLMLLFCILLNIILFTLVLSKNVSYFQTNDDYRMRLISSGLYTGDPEYQLVFIKSFIGFVLQFLYGINKTFPWYDWMTILGMFIPSTYILYQMVNKDDKLISFFNLLIYILFYLLIIKKHLFLPQFTITSAFFAMGAIASMFVVFNVLEKEQVISKVHFVFLIFFNLMCFGIRDEIAFLMFVIELFILFVYVLNFHPNKMKLIKICSIVIFALMIGQVIETISLNNYEYQEFKEYTKARSNVYDYYSIPTYEEDKEFYDSIGLESYLSEPLNGRILDVDEKLNTDTYNLIFKYNQEKSSSDILQKIKESLLQTINLFFSSNMLQQTLFIIFLILINFSIFHEYNIFRQNVFLGAIGFILFVPLVLSFRGRLIERILESVYLISLPVLFYLIDTKLDTVSFIKASINKKFNLFLASCCIIGFFTPVYMLSRDTIYNQNQAIQLLSQNIETLTQYVEKHPENFYFYDSLDFIGGSDRLFNNNEPEKILNMDSLGNWNAKSETYYKRNKNFGFTTAIEGIVEKENVYYVECGEYHNTMADLLETEYNVYMKKVDTIYTPKGIDINIYHAEKLS